MTKSMLMHLNEILIGLQSRVAVVKGMRVDEVENSLEKIMEYPRIDMRGKGKRREKKRLKKVMDDME
jgi:hypothetical protein